MSQSDDLILAGDAVTTDVFDAYLDGAYASYKPRLETVHDKLTTQMWLVRKYAAKVDAAPAAEVQAAIEACETASDALRSAETGAQRGKATALAEDAVAKIALVLPARS